MVDKDEGAQPAAPQSSLTAESAHTPLPTGLMVGLALFLLAAIAGVYWWTHSQQHTSGAPQAPEHAQQGAGAMDPTKVEAMVQGLLERLKANPNDATGWMMLARTYGVVGRANEAVDAYAKAVALRADDAALLVDYADALAVKNQRSLDGEPIRLVQKALTIDGRNVKGLAIAGKYAFDHQDFAGAVQHWQKVLDYGTPESLFAKQIAPELAQARQRLGVAAPAVVPPAAVASSASVRGTVTLASSLRAAVAPEDTVFITARAVSGTRLPLAIVRKQVKDLPVAFVLDDSMAMSTEARLSAAGKINVTARISKSGNPMPQGGDLIGSIGPVDAGASGLVLEIRDAVKP